MQDLYKGFKKVSEDENVAKLEHESGHSLTIAKNGLSRKQKSALSKLPLYQAEGTQVADEEIQDPSQQIKDVGMSIADAVAQKMVEGATQAVQREPQGQPQAPVEPPVPVQTEQMPEPNATSVQTGEPVSITPEGEMIDLQRSPLTEQAEQQVPEATLAEQPQPEPAPAVQQTMPQPAVEPTQPKPMKMARPLTPQEIIGSANTTASQKMAAYGQLALETVQEQKKLRQQLLEKNKEPIKAKTMYGENVFDNIRTVVALLLGGAGAGLTGGENPVIRMIDEDIRRDLEIQKQRKADEESLFKNAYDALGDERAAYIQAANTMREMYMMGIEEAKWAVDPANFAKQQSMDLALKEMKAKNDELDFAEATRKRKQELLTAFENTQGMSEMDPATLVDIFVDNAADKKAVLEEIGAREKIAQNTPTLLSLFDKIKKYNTFLRTLKLPYLNASLLKVPDEVDIFQNLINQVAKVQPGPERDPEMKRIFKAVTPQPWDSAEDDANKRQALLDNLRAWSISPTSRAYKLNLDKFSKTKYVDPVEKETEEMKQFARQNWNSTDPQLKKQAEWVIQKFGMQNEILDKVRDNARLFTDK